MSEIITLSQRALVATIELRACTPRYHKLNLRLYIEGKGCDGFYYGVTFDDQSNEDLSFDLTDELKCIIDPQAFEFCKGSVIDWIDDERGTGYLVENPNQWKFRGKFFKRRAWIEKLISPQSLASAPEQQS